MYQFEHIIDSRILTFNFTTNKRVIFYVPWPDKCEGELECLSQMFVLAKCWKTSGTNPYQGTWLIFVLCVAIVPGCPNCRYPAESWNTDLSVTPFMSPLLDQIVSSLICWCRQQGTKYCRARVYQCE